MSRARESILALMLLSSIGCQGGYNEPATNCDDWCEAMQRGHCADDDPADCVQECEHDLARERANQAWDGKSFPAPTRSFDAGNYVTCPHETDAYVACVMGLPDTAFECRQEHGVQPYDECQAERNAMRFCDRLSTAACLDLCDSWNTCTNGNQFSCTSECEGAVPSACPDLLVAVYRCEARQPAQCGVKPAAANSPACRAEHDALAACD